MCKHVSIFYFLFLFLRFFESQMLLANFYMWIKNLLVNFKKVFIKIKNTIVWFLFNIFFVVITGRLLKFGILQTMAWKEFHVNINGVCRSLLIGVFLLVLTFLVAIIIIDVEPLFHIIRAYVDLTRISIFSILAFIFLPGYLFMVFCCAIEMFSPAFMAIFNVNLIGFCFDMKLRVLGQE